MRDYTAQPSSNKHGPRAVDPHSPWQLAIENARAEKGITLRELATRARIPSGTLFNWVRDKKGAPPRISYTTSVNARIAQALGIPENQLADDYNASAFKPVDPQHPDPVPAPKVSENPSAFTVDGLKRFLATLKATGRESFSLAELDLAAAMILSQAVNPLDAQAPPPP